MNYSWNYNICSLQEMKEYKTRMEGMTSKMNQLEVTNSALERRIQELTDQMDALGKTYRYTY